MVQAEVLRGIFRLLVPALVLLAVLKFAPHPFHDEEDDDALQLNEELEAAARARDNGEIRGQLRRAIAAQNVREVANLLSEHPEVDLTVPTPTGGCILHFAVDRKETDASVDIVRHLLAHPHVNPNGSPSAWPPLKVAISRRSHRTIAVLLKHPQLIPEVYPAGLSCDVVDGLSQQIALVIPPQERSRDGMACFMRHPNVLLKDFSTVRAMPIDSPGAVLALLPSWSPAAIGAYFTCAILHVGMVVGVLALNSGLPPHQR
jgi:hypothetical protein